MLRTPVGFLLLLAAAAPASALAAQNGVYSNVCISPQSGDFEGMTLTLSGAAGHPSVELVVCEGACWNARISDVSIERDRLTFTGEELALNDHNAVAKDMFYRFAGQFAQSALTLSATMVYGPQTLTLSGAPPSQTDGRGQLALSTCR